MVLISLQNIPTYHETNLCNPHSTVYFHGESNTLNCWDSAKTKTSPTEITKTAAAVESKFEAMMSYSFEVFFFKSLVGLFHQVVELHEWKIPIIVVCYRASSVPRMRPKTTNGTEPSRSAQHSWMLNAHYYLSGKTPTWRYFGFMYIFPHQIFYLSSVSLLSSSTVVVIDVGKIYCSYCRSATDEFFETFSVLF